MERGGEAGALTTIEVGAKVPGEGGREGTGFVADGGEGRVEEWSNPPF